LDPRTEFNGKEDRRQRVANQSWEQPDGHGIDTACLQAAGTTLTPTLSLVRERVEKDILFLVRERAEKEELLLIRKCGHRFAAGSAPTNIRAAIPCPLPDQGEGEGDASDNEPRIFIAARSRF
jgi:hypothetical protein